MTTNGTTAVVEYGHVYLGDDAPAEIRPASPDLVPQIEDSLITDGFDVELLLIIDDTTTIPQEFGSQAFTEYRDTFTTRYLESLRPEPDYVLFESAFEPVIETIIDTVPTVTDSDLSDDSAWGYRHAGEKAYLYGPGPNRTKVKVRDESDGSAKSRPYTCAMYDTAITVSKLAATGGLPACPAGDLSVTVHDTAYLESQTLRDSAGIQEVLREHEILEWATEAHYELGDRDGAHRELMGQLEL